jgi:hypothetical protein
VAISAYFGQVVVPLNYVAGMAVTDSATWSGTTLAALGLTPGTFTISYAPQQQNPSAITSTALSNGTFTVVVNAVP